MGTEQLAQPMTLLGPGIMSTVLIAILALAGIIVNHFIFVGIGKIAARHDSAMLKPLVKYWKRPAGLAVALLLVSLVFPFLEYPESVEAFLRHFMTLAVVAVLTWLGIRAVYIYRDILLSKYDYGDVTDDLDRRRLQTQVNILIRIAVIIISVVGFSLGLMTFPEIQKIGISLLASAGILGVILGFAAQKSLANLLAGIQLAFAQPIRIKDVVIIEGEYGVIEEITLTYAVVRIWDKRRLIVPISFFLENTFQNWTRVSADLLGTVFISADYMVSVDAVRGELKRILEGSNLWDGAASGIQVTNCTDSSLELRALVSAADASRLWDLRCHVREKLVDFIRENYPGSLPTMRVSLDSSK